jgi:2-oxoisovalerate dehydrogenase E2 component (dihydrolipoyl transacylase)
MKVFSIPPIPHPVSLSTESPCLAGNHITDCAWKSASPSLHNRIVPVLRNVAERSVSDLRAGLDRLRADAIARSIPPEELRGATITLSDFGMIGGRFANLIIVPPQAAIIGAGRISQRVVAHRGQPAVRRVLPLSLTFDHRVVTGGEGARFLVALRSDLELMS